jgi:hypothetical protein
MKTYAVLDKSSTVINLIIAANLEIAELVSESVCVLVTPGTDAKIGDLYAEGTFSTPE